MLLLQHIYTLFLFRSYTTFEYISINPTHGLPKLKETPEKPTIPTIDEFRVLLDELPPTIKYMTMFGVHTGLRPRNSIELQWDQLDIDGEYVVIDSYKGSNNRNAPPFLLKLHPELLELIGMVEKSKQPGEIYVFPKSINSHIRIFQLHGIELVIEQKYLNF